LKVEPGFPSRLERDRKAFVGLVRGLENTGRIKRRRITRYRREREVFVIPDGVLIQTEATTS
jgi:hypothetical protein